MSLSKKNNTEFNDFTSELLLKFLTQNMVNRDLLKGLLTRVQKKNNPSYGECLAASKLLLSHNAGSKLIQLSLPMFKNEHYLHLIPANIEKVSNLLILRFEVSLCSSTTIGRQ
jgi:hypothetical protein